MLARWRFLGHLDAVALIARVLVDAEERFAQVAGQGAQLFSAPPYAGGLLDGPTVPWPAGHPVASVAPSKIIGVGKNYRDHAAEMGGEVPREPLLFLKPPSSVLAAGVALHLPKISEHVEFEAELGVVIGRTARHVSAADAYDYVFGYVPLCDVTARDLQRNDGQWARAKGIDGFCPVGPAIETELASPSDLKVRLWLNGELRQDGNTRDMVFDIPTLVAHISQAMTLVPGDLIATGTPAGVGKLSAGDHVLITVGQMPALEFRVEGP